MKNLAVQKVDQNKLFSNVELSNKILLVFMVDLSLYNTTIQNTEISSETALLKCLNIAKEIVDCHYYKYTENLIFLQHKVVFGKFEDK